MYEGGCSARGVSAVGVELDIIGSKLVGSTDSWLLRVGRSAGETESERPCREWVELCALGFELDGIRFFLSLFRSFLSVSPDGDLKKPMRSRDGVRASGCFSGSPSSLSWLATALEGARLDAPVVLGGKAGDDGDTFRAVSKGAAGDKPLGGACVLDGMPGAPAVGEGVPDCFCSRPWGKPGDLLDGTVLLR